MAVEITGSTRDIERAFGRASGDEAVTINLGRDCKTDECAAFAQRLHDQLAHGGYTWPCSVLPLPDTFADYLATVRTARKRAARAVRLGYRFAEIDRGLHADDVYAINTSTPERQGRPMSKGYAERPVFSRLPMICPRHHVYTYGVLDTRGTLAAYLWLYRLGDLAMVSSILGHADRLRDDVMYLLATEAVREQTPLGGFLFYNMHDGGTEGLRFFKTRLGLKPAHVDWALA